MQIGLILKTDESLDGLGKDWVPKPIGEISSIYNAFEKVLGFIPESNEFCYDQKGCLIYFTIENDEFPKSISVNYGSGDKELSTIKELCSVLGTKFYDSEACDFVNL
jgi:hypothetical protein